MFRIEPTCLTREMTAVPGGSSNQPSSPSMSRHIPWKSCQRMDVILVASSLTSCDIAELECWARQGRRQFGSDSVEKTDGASHQRGNARRCANPHFPFSCGLKLGAPLQDAQVRTPRCRWLFVRLPNAFVLCWRASVDARPLHSKAYFSPEATSLGRFLTLSLQKVDCIDKTRGSEGMSQMTSSEDFSSGRWSTSGHKSSLYSLLTGAGSHILHAMTEFDDCHCVCEWYWPV